MNEVPIAQVYAVVKDALDYSDKRWTDKEVKEFVDRFLTKTPVPPDPKGCIYADKGICYFTFQAKLGGIYPPCVGLDACRKAEMLLGVKL